MDVTLYNTGSQKGDIDISGGDLKLLDGADAIRQHLFIRLQMFVGDYFLDRRVGMPYYEQVLIKNPKTNIVRRLFRNAILTTPGVSSLTDLLIDYNGQTRSLAVSFNAIVETDQQLTFNEVLVI